MTLRGKIDAKDKDILVSTPLFQKIPSFAYRSGFPKTSAF
jgi:hypothetical protein